MTCTPIKLPNGMVGIACGRGRPKVKRCKCGRPRTKECDWKVGTVTPGGHQRTCDEPLCEHCTFSPAEEKDLCPAHKFEYERWLKERGSR